MKLTIHRHTSARALAERTLTKTVGKKSACLAFGQFSLPPTLSVNISQSNGTLFIITSMQMLSFCQTKLIFFSFSGLRLLEYLVSTHTHSTPKRKKRSAKKDVHFSPSKNSIERCPCPCPSPIATLHRKRDSDVGGRRTQKVFFPNYFDSVASIE